MVRILIADDKELVRTGLKMLLEGHEGWVVCGEANDGCEAVEKAIELKPDVILLDIIMPKLDSLRACRFIREKVPSAEILVLTLYQSLDMPRVAADAGARAYISKAFIPSDLILAIEAMTTHQPVSSLSDS